VSDLFYVVGDMSGVGGIETLLIKVLNELAARGHSVMFSGKRGGLTHLFHRTVRHLPDSKSATILQQAGDDGASSMTILSLHPWELLRASILARELSKHGHGVRGFHLVTHSRAFFFDSRLRLATRLLRQAFLRSPRASTYFMNIAARDGHQARWMLDLSDYPILTLPLAPASAAWKPHGGSGPNIVSVGRLVPFKGYNRAAPKVVRTLRESGIEITWDIWGDGPDQQMIDDAIRHAGVGEWLHLRGPLPYEEFDATMAKYDLFIGMGTALLEAGRIGMPAITAVEGTEDQTYGFLHETPLDSVGDRVVGATTRTLEDAIMTFARLDAAGTEAVGRSSREASIQRSSSVEQVADAMQSAQPWLLNQSDDTWLRQASWVLGLQRLRGLLRRASVH